MTEQLYKALHSALPDLISQIFNLIVVSTDTTSRKEE